MTDDLVKRLRKRQEFEFIDGHKRVEWEDEDALEAADRIEALEYALRSIAEGPLGKEIPDRTTIWGLATYMQEAAKDALKEGK